jgi:hypothetical protein
VCHPSLAIRTGEGTHHHVSSGEAENSHARRIFHAARLVGPSRSTQRHDRGGIVDPMPVVDDVEERIGTTRLDQHGNRKSAGAPSILEELVMLFGIRGLA